MRRGVDEESGFVLVAAIIVLMITLGLGVALAATVENQLHATNYEANRESSFTLANAALAAQSLQLGRTWPKTSPAVTSCDPTSTIAACPSGAAIAGGYTGTAYNTSCATAPTTPIWKTTVRDNVAGESYWSTAVNARAAYDGANDGVAGGDGVLWVRATATVRCRVQSLVAEVRLDHLAGIDFPGNVITANWFATGNQGRKVIVDTLGSYAQPPSAQPGPASQASNLVLRCISGPSPCASYAAGKGQVQPPTVRQDPATSNASLDPAQLLALKQQAISTGSYFAAGTCPSGAQLTSAAAAPVYVEGPCSVTVAGNTQVNSAAAPGALVIVNGTFSIGGTGSFYGLLYCVNAQGSNGAVVSVGGNGQIQGLISVDGAGGVVAGSSKTNVIYDPRASHLLTGSAGATLLKNTWRQLPSNTP
ncbi:MAG: hypothetical protein QOK31_151 [Solirubrobacteraceae bacterium]|jgi:Tfp pilus assembly protein PilX|nr:hypothetical protein [Solirubrobacteraceae bacterium]